ncbi:kinase-like protein [Rhizophagus irregularis]|uniref:Kinase-like protein n=1 Tax=Rhizophagus irregularis TaxID=588596 RepID=A0A2N0NXL7_9GLOM|nr:kinase-like protein [Rhizophagus irregularis]PKC01927.1 kinase-like protein [Rhizophagus irregularis]
MLNEKEKSNDHNDWLKNSIKDEYLSYYDYSNFEITKTIGFGNFGKVLRANLKDTDTIFALKSFNIKFALKDIVNEIKLHRHVDIHQNILRFHGITWMESETFHRSYSLVLQYADSGTLETYLTEHFNELDWNDKHQLAFQLASAVECIHNLDIIYCDLNVGNMKKAIVQI